MKWTIPLVIPTTGKRSFARSVKSTGAETSAGSGCPAVMAASDSLTDTLLGKAPRFATSRFPPPKAQAWVQDL
jgi:hypothetical protein